MSCLNFSELFGSLSLNIFYVFSGSSSYLHLPPPSPPLPPPSCPYSSSWVPKITFRFSLEIIPWPLDPLFFSHSFLIMFDLYNFCWPIFKFTHCVLGSIEYSDKPTESILHLLSCFLIFNIYLFFCFPFLSSYSLVCFQHFPLKALALLMIMIENPLAECFNIYVLGKSGSVDSFVIHFFSFWIFCS